MSSRTILHVALGVSLVAGGVSAQEETGGFGVAKQTSLELLRQAPHAFKNVWVQFDGQFLGLGTVHNPFFTRFTRADFVNFAAWGDEQRIWQREDYDRPCSTLFCKKSDGEQLTTVYGLQRYQRVRLKGVVRNAFQGEPWVEITSIEPLEGKLTTATLTHMARAHKLMQAHKWQQAAVELNLASSRSLTDSSRGWIHAYLGLCLMRLGRPEEARSELARAKTFLPEEAMLDQWMATLTTDPRSAVDTHVKTAQVRRGDRPMWEAVETGKGDTKSTETTPQPQKAPASKAPSKPQK